MKQNSQMAIWPWPLTPIITEIMWGPIKNVCMLRDQFFFILERKVVKKCSKNMQKKFTSAIWPSPLTSIIIEICRVPKGMFALVKRPYFLTLKIITVNKWSINCNIHKNGYLTLTFDLHNNKDYTVCAKNEKHVCTGKYKKYW